MILNWCVRINSSKITVDFFSGTNQNFINIQVIKLSSTSFIIIFLHWYINF